MNYTNYATTNDTKSTENQYYFTPHYQLPSAHGIIHCHWEHSPLTHTLNHINPDKTILKQNRGVLVPIGSHGRPIRLKLTPIQIKSAARAGLSPCYGLTVVKAYMIT